MGSLALHMICHGALLAVPGRRVSYTHALSFCWHCTGPACLQSLLLAATTLLGFTLVHSWRSSGVVLLVALFWLFPGTVPAMSWNLVLPGASPPLRWPFVSVDFSLALRRLAAASTRFFLALRWLFAGAALLWPARDAALALSRHRCCSRSVLLLGLPWHCNNLAWSLTGVSRARRSLYPLSDFLLALAWCCPGYVHALHSSGMPLVIA
jgi:hypothetical protein